MNLFTTMFQGDFFGTKNPVKKLLLTAFSEILALCKLNFLFLIFSVPIFTIGPAWAALTQVSIQLLDGDCPRPAASFLRAFKKHFKSSMLASLLCGGACVIAFVSSYMYWRNAQSNPAFLVLLFISAALLILLLLTFMYIIPLIILIDHPLRVSFWNAFLLVLSCVHHSLPAVACVACLVLAAFLGFPFTIPFGAVLLFSLSNLIMTYAAWLDIRNYIIKE